MSHLILRCVALVCALPLFAAIASSQCVNPPNPSVAICTPSPNSTAVYEAAVEVVFTPASGAKIRQIIIYDNGRVMSNTGFNQEPGVIYDADVMDGQHHLLVHAWDTKGNFFHTEEVFHVVGDGYPFCKVPNNLGVNFCIPPKNAFLDVQFTLGAAARGLSRITSLCFYINDVLVQSCGNTNAAVIPVVVQQQGVPYTAKVVATDSGGHVYSATKTVEAQYTYAQYGCFYSCVPGVNPISPLPDTYVSDSFTLNMQILDNPNPITSMTAYIDSTVIATSSGSTLNQQITGAPQGTHILTVTGVDTQGIVYYYRENINIDISI